MTSTHQSGFVNNTTGSRVVVCTDGLANVGCGSLDDDDKFKTAKAFWMNLAEHALQRSVSVSIVTIDGTEVCLPSAPTHEHSYVRIQIMMIHRLLRTRAFVPHTHTHTHTHIHTSTYPRIARTPTHTCACAHTHIQKHNHALERNTTSTHV